MTLPFFRFTPSLRSQSFAACFVGLTALPGAWIFATAPVSGLGTDVFAGTVQRHYETRFEDRFPLRDAIRQTWNAAKYSAFGELAEGAIAGKDGVFFTAEEFTRPLEHPDFVGVLKDVHDQIAKTGAELVPIIVPDKARMMSGNLPRARSPHFEKRYDQLQSDIARAGLRTVDLRPVLATAGSYMATDTHWSPEGAQAVAQAVAQLLGDDLKTEATFATTQVGTREFKGDLLAFADTGIWRQWVGPNFETISTYETDEQAAGLVGLFDDVTTPVALVGTSFSARTDFHFNSFLKSELWSDVLSFAKEGQGPFPPMEQFLESGTLAEANPQIVIWEIPERYLDTWSNDQ